MVGGIAWGAGGVATFVGGNGSGAVALIGSGLAVVLLGLIGRWPQRISLSGNEIGWDDVRRTVESTIEVTQGRPDSESLTEELQALLDRLELLQRTGTVPEHPAIAYDWALRAAVERLFPGERLIQATAHRREVPDFTLQVDGRRVHIESKWRHDVHRPMEGSTLPRLAAAVRDDRLLVVSNAHDVVAAQQVAEQLFPGRSRVVSWRDLRDDGALAEALRELLAG